MKTKFRERERGGRYIILLGVPNKLFSHHIDELSVEPSPFGPALESEIIWQNTSHSNKKRQKKKEREKRSASKFKLFHL